MYVDSTRRDTGKMHDLASHGALDEEDIIKTFAPRSRINVSKINMLTNVVAPTFLTVACITRINDVIATWNQGTALLQFLHRYGYNAGCQQR